MKKKYCFFFFCLAMAYTLNSCGQKEAVKAESNKMSENKMESTLKLDTATLGAGCFWCVEAIYEGLDGVQSVVSGYSGGKVKNPTYKEVCTGNTGHAEVAQITYDPNKVSYEEILEVFWRTHDPTTLNRQGNDVGTQYRSVIFYHNEIQKQIAQKSKEAMMESGLWDNPVVTEISPLDIFYPAEEYHQEYFKNNPTQSYCMYVVGPKVDKFKKLFKDKLKESATQH